MQTKITSYFNNTNSSINSSINSNINKKTIKSNLKKSICIYTDGSCRNNGKKNAIAGIGVYIENICKISEPIVGRQTNQRAELFAILKALQIINISDYSEINIYTDSKYSINCITNWINLWLKNNWLDKKKQPIKNKDIIQSIHNIYKKYNNIHLIHILAHTNNKDIHSIGNSIADKLANQVK